MKKHLLKFFTLIFGFALILTGCATVSSIPNDSKEILYYGGSSVTVGDYTYFANAYTPYSSSTEFDYAGNSKVSYLARINSENLEAENGKDFSPNNVEKVADKVAGFQHQDMFVLGDFIFFTSMNTHQSAHPIEYNFSLVTLWRCSLNGDGLKELFTTQYFSDSGKFAPVGDKDNGYYWLCYTGSYSQGSTYSGQVYSIDLTGRASKATLIAEKAASAVYADVNEDGNLDKVFYTTVEGEDDQAQTKIYSVDYSGENKTPYNNNGQTVSLVEKVKDDVFYTVDDTVKASLTLYRNVANIQKDEKFDNGEKTFAYGMIDDIQLVSKNDAFEGYLYISTSSGSLMYSRRPEKALLKKNDFTDILFVEDEYVYYSNSDTNTISRISVKKMSGSDSDQPQPEEMVKMTKLQSGQYGADKNYIYFFANLEDVELEGESEENPQTDENMYMYRVRKGGGEYQLVSKTANQRTPKKVEE